MPLYIQNFNLSLQRELADNLVLDLSYVGSKGSKLYGHLPLNTVNIHDTRFLEAFNVTRAGGNHPLFDHRTNYSFPELALSIT